MPSKLGFGNTRKKTGKKYQYGVDSKNPIQMGSPYKHTDTPGHPEHHDDEFFKGETKEWVNKAEDFYHTEIEPRVKDPVKTAKEFLPLALDAVIPGAGKYTYLKRKQKKGVSKPTVTKGLKKLTKAAVKTYKKAKEKIK